MGNVLLTEFLGLEFTLEETADAQSVEITLPAAEDCKRLLVFEGLFRIAEERWLTSDPLPQLPLPKWDVAGCRLRPTLVSQVLPVLYGERLGNGSFLEEDPDEIRLGVDVFGSAFFMLTRYEELVRPERDLHARFPAEASVACAEDFSDRPLVNEYLEVLWCAMSSLWPRLQRISRSFSQHPSHDVDYRFCTGTTARAVGKSAAGDLLRRRDMRLAAQRVRSFRRTRCGDPDADICNSFDMLMEIAETRGIKTSFNFIADHASDLDGDYSLVDPWIRRLLRRIYDRGHEIGFHPSYQSFQDSGRTRREFEELLGVCHELGIQQEQWGGRQHFLRWENPTTWQNWEDAGLAYDSTLGFADRIGFRSGVCYEYPVFNLETGRELKLRERPLVVMEVALLSHMGLGPRRTVDEIARLKTACRLFNGDFTLLWHNSLTRSPRERRVYEEALEHG